MADNKKPFIDFVTFNHKRDAEEIVNDYEKYINTFNECKHCKKCVELEYNKPAMKGKDAVRFKYCNGVKDLIKSHKWQISRYNRILSDGRNSYLSLMYKQTPEGYVHYLNNNFKDFRLKNVYISDNRYCKKRHRNNVQDSIILDDNLKYKVTIKRYKKSDICKTFDNERDAFIYYANYYKHPEIKFTNEEIDKFGGIDRLIELKHNNYFITDIEKEFGLSKSIIYHFLRQNDTKFIKL